MRSKIFLTTFCLLSLLSVLAQAAFAESQSKTVQVTATILPRLELSVLPETGSSIAFGAITQPSAQEGTASNTVAVNLSVFSNLDRPYQVTQTLRRHLTNENGAIIPDDQFLISIRNATFGTTENATPIPVNSGNTQTLYNSNARGKSDAFVADYRLNVTPQTPAGNFTSEVLYTVTSL